MIFGDVTGQLLIQRVQELNVFGISHPNIGANGSSLRRMAGMGAGMPLNVLDTIVMGA